MPARSFDQNHLPSLLLRSHISTTSSVEDLPDTEAAHKDALAAAKAEHQRVRESALRAYKNNELKEAHARLLKLQHQEVERLKLESERAQLAAHVLELQEKRIPIPSPRQPTPPPAPEPKPAGATSILVGSNHKASPGPQDKASNLPPQPENEPPLRPVEQKKSAVILPESPRIQDHQHDQRRQQDIDVRVPVPQSTKLSNTANSQTTHDHASGESLPGAEQFLVIHKRLKQLRAFMIEHAKKDAALKKRMGEMRREIRKCVGQLTEGRGANRTPLKTIVDILKEALHSNRSPLVDAGMVLLSIPAQVQGALNNGDKLPALFLYLLNIFSKAVISQFTDEAGVSPKTADPIGVIAVSVFAQSDLCWRDTSFIDILICKFRVVCPVLFGIRGNEKTEEGRKRLGWWRGEGGEWISEQVHNTRMTGLGAGYAAISLRDFSNSKNKNPYPPWKYWQSMASIVNTPVGETSSTQYVVLKAMIENYEQRFMNFYGSAARAALQVALVDFPGRAPETNVAVTSLKVLGDKLRRDAGLRLKPYSANH